MKKIILFSLIILSATNFIFAQGIVNSSFETWEGGAPAGWFTSNLFNIYIPITQSTDAHSGSYAVKGNVIDAPGGSGYTALIAAGLDANGFPINFRPSFLKGWYKFISDSGDAFSATVVAVKNRRAIGSGGFYSAESHTDYTEFATNITYNSTEIPDTIQILILIANAPKIHLASYYILDDLSLETSTGIAENSNIINDYKLEQNYPNPFNPVTNIEFQVPHSGMVSLKVFDVLGNEIITLINEEKPAGKYKIQFDASKLTSGIYFYELSADEFSDIKKLTVLK